MKITAYLAPELADRFPVGDGGPTQRLNHVVAAYLDMVERSVPRLTTSEWGYAFDTLNGTMIDLNAASFLAAELHDAHHYNDASEKWGIDGLALAERIHAMTQAERWAIVEMSWRFWALHLDDSLEEALEKMGLA